MRSVEHASSLLVSQKSSIAEKMRALFTLRNIHTDGAAKAVEKAFSDRSVLLKHEAAYVLGQMTRKCSVEALIAVLRNEDEDEIVRHEAAEALGNYGMEDNVWVLEEFVAHKSTPLRETCQIAIQKLRTGRMEKVSMFQSLDPAHPAETDIEKARDCFVDKDSNLYSRYEMMFFLRNLMTKEAVEVLAEGLSDESVLFKHEVAFVLGQMRMEEATAHLIRVLEDHTEHAMVRHECAEALGAIGTEAAKNALVPFLTSNIDVIRESVEVALDIYSHRISSEEEYCMAK